MGITCAVDGEKSLDCGAKLGKQSCCEGLVCHEDQYWRGVQPDKTTCSGPNTLPQECGSDWEDASEKCCEGLVCGDDNFACLHNWLHQVKYGQDACINNIHGLFFHNCCAQFEIKVFIDILIFFTRT